MMHCSRGMQQVWRRVVSIHPLAYIPKRPVVTNAAAAPHEASSQGEVQQATRADPKAWIGCEQRNRIYCNRALNMKSILAVGFDMDYTLAQYKPETFESLAYEGTIKKLVYNLRYPRQILDWKFDWQYMVRGLVLDKRRGNILKMDRHKYVKVAYHGFQELSREERVASYRNTLSRDAFDEPDYALIDTLFSLAEAYLFAQLVELKDGNPMLFPHHSEVYCEDGIPVSPTYAQIYQDVRAAVDLCHRDGTVKQAVAAEPSKFIHTDRQLITMLKMLRNSGRMTFLVTNSLWDYTDVVMSHLFAECEGTNAQEDKWLNYFDLVITGSAKPGFFKEGSQAPLFAVDIKSGMLHNTDNGAPILQVGAVGMNSHWSGKHASKVYQGGTVAHLHKLLAIEAAAQVMYVGDHIYGDILRSKKQLGWRTMLVVPELEKEVQLLDAASSVHKEIQMLRQQREHIDDELQSIHWRVRTFGDSVDGKQLQTKLAALEIEKVRVDNLHRTLQRHFHEKFHGTWGRVMKAGHQTSRFAHQVERFACLYTSQVTNLCYYSPDKCFRTSEDFMPHELDDRTHSADLLPAS